MTTYTIASDELQKLVEGVTVNIGEGFKGPVCLILSMKALSFARAQMKEDAETSMSAHQSDEDLARTIAQAAKELSERGLKVELLVAPDAKHPYDVVISRRVSSRD